MGLLPCEGCTQTFAKADYSRAQLKKGAARRCASCVKAPQPSPGPTVTEAEGDENSKAMMPFTAAATVIDGVQSGSGMRTVLYALPIPDRLRPTVTALVSGALLEKDTLAAACAAASRSQDLWITRAIPSA